MRRARRFQTLYEMFEDLSAGKRDPRAPTGRLPVLLLLGGGMAAGKSTVREIIGHDDFWSKARAYACISVHSTQIRSVWGSFACVRCPLAGRACSDPANAVFELNI